MISMRLIHCLGWMIQLYEGGGVLYFYYSQHLLDSLFIMSAHLLKNLNSEWKKLAKSV